MLGNPGTWEVEAEGSRFQGHSLTHEIESQNNKSGTEQNSRGYIVTSSSKETLQQHPQRIHCNSILEGFRSTLKSAKCYSATDVATEEPQSLVGFRASVAAVAAPLTKRGKDTESQATLSTTESFLQ